MNPINPFFSIIIVLIAATTAYLLSFKYKKKHYSIRNQSIDGLRGLLAIGVFIHHASIWHQYIESRSWNLPSSNLFIHFGETSVTLFFMITSFLFVSKMIESKDSNFNWRDFFISRFLRIAPLYYFSLIVIVFVVLYLSNWQLNVSAFGFIRSMLDWVLFTIIGTTEINNSSYTNFINAGVTWSLAYEWLFYCSLPLIYLFIKNKLPKTSYLILSITFISIFYYFHGILSNHIFAFLGGAIAPFLKKYISINSTTKETLASAAILICFYLIGRFDTAANNICLIFTTIAFSLIALGASLFGLLKTSSLKFLGDISYSIYLFHGIILFSTFHLIIGYSNVKLYTKQEYCLLIFLITPIVVMMSYLCYQFIEKPSIDYSKKLIIKLHQKNHKV